MISFLIALAPWIPAILSIATALMDLFGVSDKQMREYEDMVKRLNSDGTLSVKAHDRLIAHKEAILKRLKEKEDKKNGVGPKL